MKKSNKQNKWTLLGFDSAEEMYFDAWCKELNLNVRYKPTTLTLSEPIKIQQQKARSVVYAHLFNDAQYTPDFVIYRPFLDSMGDYLFCLDISDQPIKTPLKNCLFKTTNGEIFIDTKGSNFMSSNRTSDIRFSLIQKWVYKECSLYINSVVPEKLFERTFAPECFFWSETGKERTKKGVPFSKLYKRIGDI